ncbi:hypothetical protein [Streptomyces sp. I05A-00742]|uniref:hypothetical protein n=1 Tax=Streptomyces sp. I05A-00742 TaxID=2732853 RepID=UPI001487A129|nr:hypothetical protein [Streptomyces sp. I05A-00742]
MRAGGRTGRPAALASVPVVAALVLTSCGGGDSGEGARSEKDTAGAYVAALNARDVDALVRLGPSGHEGAAEDARRIVAEKGGRGLSVTSVDVSHEFGPDTADAVVSATDGGGTVRRETVTLVRDGERWCVPLGRKEGAAPKQTSGVGR